MNLRMVNGDTSLFRHWHQRFVTALGQVEGSHEEIVQKLVKVTDLGKELGKVVENLRRTHGEDFKRVSRDVCNILLGEAEKEASGKIKMVHKRGDQCLRRLVPLAH
jgi:hypothetical protein